MRTMLVLLLVLGCTKPMTNTTATQPADAATQSAPPVVTGPRVILPDGFVVKVEIADDPDTRARGLMYRDHLPAGEGMLFFFPQPGEYPFWMKNTRIPLDIMWVDSNRRVAHVKYQVPPCKFDPCPSYPPNAQARYVLEVAGGVAQQHGIKAGDVLRFEGTDPFELR